MVKLIFYHSFLALSVLIVDVTSSLIPLCPVATAGKSYQFVCTGRTKTDARFVLWDRYFEENGTKVEISRCYFDKPCNTFQDKRYQVTNVPNEYSFQSTLTISNVTEADNNMTINCSAMEAATFPLSDPNVFMSCRLPVFDIAQEPSCIAKLAPPDVQIACNFPKVHPKLTCELGYDSKFFLKKALVEYDVKPLTLLSLAYYNITCKGSLKLESLSQKSYFVRILPNFETEMPRQELENQARVQTVALMLTTQVVINSPPYMAICPPTWTSNETVYCSATNSTLKPVIHFFIDNEEILAVKPSYQYPGQLYTTLQEFTFRVDQTFQDKVLKCQVDGLNNETAKVNLAIPPAKPPLFLSHDGISLNSIITVDENETITVQCRLVDDGLPRVSNITVNCFNVNGTKIIQVNNTSNMVFFTVVGSEHLPGSWCVCSAHHVSGCYNLVALLAILDSKGNNTPGGLENTNVYTYLLYVAAVFVGIIFIPIIVATCVFVIRHWDELYHKHPKHKTNPTNAHYTYIDDIQVRDDRKSKRRQSSQTESSVSLNSEFSRRYRDHIELHHLQEGTVRLAAPEEYILNNGDFRYTGSPRPAPPPCGRPARNDRGSTPSESDSTYDKHIQALPSHNKSSSVDSRSEPPRKRNPSYEDENQNSYNPNDQPRKDVNMHYRHGRGSTDRGHSYQDDLQDDTYVSPTTSYSSDEDLSKRHRFEEEEHLRSAEEDEENARRLEEERLLRLLEIGGTSYDEDISADQLMSEPRI